MGSRENNYQPTQAALTSWKPQALRPHLLEEQRQPWPGPGARCWGAFTWGRGAAAPVSTGRAGAGAALFWTSKWARSLAFSYFTVLRRRVF